MKKNIKETVLSCTLITTGECKRTAKLANSIIMLYAHEHNEATLRLIILR